MLTIWFSLMALSIAAVRVQPVLDEQRIARHAKAEGEIYHSGKGEAREQGGRRRPNRIGERRSQRSEQIEQRHDRDQGSILEQGDEAVDETGNDMAKRLRHYDQRRGLPPR